MGSVCVVGGVLKQFQCICSVKCQLSDYVFLRRVPRRTIIAKI